MQPSEISICWHITRQIVLEMGNSGVFKYGWSPLPVHRYFTRHGAQGTTRHIELRSTKNMMGPMPFLGRWTQIHRICWRIALVVSGVKRAKGDLVARNSC